MFFGEGVTLGVCCTNGLDFLVFFWILRLMGWDGTEVVPDGWMDGKR